MKIYAATGSNQFEFEAVSENGKKILKRDGRIVEYDLVHLGKNRYSVLINNKSYLLHIEPDDKDMQIDMKGDVFYIRVEDERLRALKKLVNLSRSEVQEVAIKAPIPGLVVKISVQQGDTVKKDSGLLVLEAMKMENIIMAPHDCEVLEVSVKERESVTKGQVLLYLKSIY